MLLILKPESLAFIWYVVWLHPIKFGATPSLVTFEKKRCFFSSSFFHQLALYNILLSCTRMYVINHILT